MKKSIYYQDCYALSSKFLRGRGFFDPDSLKFIDFEFESAGEPYRVRALVTMAGEPTLMLRIEYGGKVRRVNVKLIARHNHLGGVGYKFACPHTGAGSYKLYFVRGVVGSRSHFKLLDRCQVKSARTKELDMKYGPIIKADEARAVINSKHFKRFKNGRRTKRYKRLLEIIKQAEGLDYEGLL